MKIKLPILILLVILQCGCGRREEPAEITDVKGTAEKELFECSFGGKPRRFSIYLPESAEGDLPLILMLHGYASSPEAFRRETRMEEVACARGFAVAYAGMGGVEWKGRVGTSTEDDVTWLTALARYLQKTYKCNPERTYAVGFSNGAFMTQELAVHAQDTFSAVCSVAGSMPKLTWELRKEKADIGVMILYGTGDAVVPKRSDGSNETAYDPPIEDVMDYWSRANALDRKTVEKLSARASLTRYTAAGASKEVCGIEIEGGQHSWPKEAFCGFDPYRVILDFFDRCK